MSDSGQRRYNRVAMALHWIIALAIISMIPFGWWMSDLPNSLDKLQYYQLHKSAGLTVLVLSLVRLGWRLTHRVPPFPPGMAGWERTAATAAHWGFYVLMIAMPLAGWAMVSASPIGVPTDYFFLFHWPHLPVLPDLPEATRERLNETFEFIHSKMAWAFIALLVLHVGAALKHQFHERVDLLQRMIPIPFSNR